MFIPPPQPGAPPQQPYQYINPTLFINPGADPQNSQQIPPHSQQLFPPQVNVYIAAPVEKQSNGLAVAGLTLGILAVCLIWSVVGIIFSLIGLILAICGLSAAKKKKNAGQGKAIAGIILSSIAFLFWIVVITILVFA